MKNNKGEGSVALKEGGGLINFLPLKREVLLERGINRGITEYLFSLFIFFFVCFSLKTARVQSKEEIARQASPYNSTVYVGNLPPYCTGNI